MRLKLSGHAFTRFWDVHAWSGVAGGLVLYMMFLTGSITLFHEQLAAWEEPLRQVPVAKSASLQQALEQGLAAAGETRGSLWFYPPSNGFGLPRLGFESATTEAFQNVWIDAKQGAVIPERERLSALLYELHFLWHDSTGDFLYYVGGALALSLLLALVTGVLIHLKDLVRQFHQFRPEKAPRVVFSDLHKVLGVMGLPFQLVYAFTGAFIVLAPLSLDAFAGPVFGGDTERASQLLWDRPEESTAALGKAEGFSADELLRRARAAAPGLSPEYVRISHHGRENAVFEVGGAGSGTPRGHTQVRVRQTDGAVLEVKSQDSEGETSTVRRWLLGLHFADFGGVVVRFLFFALGLASCVTLLTGNWIWLARREARRSSLGNRLLSRLTAGIGVGTPLAIGALFLASRSFPLDWSSRGVLEELTFASVLCSTIGWAFVVRDTRAVWWQGLALTGAALVAATLLAQRWSEAGLFGSARQAVVVGVEVALLASAVASFAGSALLRARC